MWLFTKKPPGGANLCERLLWSAVKVKDKSTCPFCRGVSKKEKRGGGECGPPSHWVCLVPIC